MKNKILILSQEQPPIVGGAGIIALQLFENLTARGWNVSINKSNVNLSRVLSFFVSFLTTFKSFYCNTVIINDLFYKKLFCLFIKLYRINNTLIYLHGSEPEFLLSSPFYKDRFIELCLNSKGVIAVSDYMKEKFLSHLLEHPHYSEIEKKIVVIRNGVDTNTFHHIKGISSNASINIATCCRLEWGKGFKDMTNVFVKLLEKGEEYHWYIAGNGKDSASIKAYILERGIADNVTFLGVLSRNEVASLFNTCQFMLLLSNFKESLGLAYMEASCCGCYSIGRNRYGVKEAIINGETGVLVDSLDEAVDVILSMKIDSKAISKTAFDNYSCESMYNSIESLIK